MTFEEYKKEKQSLEEKLLRLKLEFCQKQTGFKIGDEVEFTYINYIDDYDTEILYMQNKISDMHVYNSNVIYFKVWSQTVKFEDVKRYDPNDYTLRDKVYAGVDMEIGDTFYFRNQISNITLHKQYTVIKKIESDEGTEYMYYDDNNSLQVLKNNEYRIRE